MDRRTFFATSAADENPMRSTGYSSSFHRPQNSSRAITRSRPRGMTSTVLFGCTGSYSPICTAVLRIVPSRRDSQHLDVQSPGESGAGNWAMLGHRWGLPPRSRVRNQTRRQTPSFSASPTPPEAAWGWRRTCSWGYSLVLNSVPRGLERVSRCCSVFEGWTAVSNASAAATLKLDGVQPRR